MTVKVGDTVRIVADRIDLTVGKEYKVVDVDCGEPAVIDDAGDRNFLGKAYYAICDTITDPIITQVREEMEDCMANGRYVKAVKWAQIAEMIKEIEDDQ